MEIEHKDFIGIYKGALPKEVCSAIVTDFENHLAVNPPHINGSTHFSNRELGREDVSVFAEKCLPDAAKLVNRMLHECLPLYEKEFFTLKVIRARSEVVKIQRTPPRGGYHVWHTECDSRTNMDRVLTWIVYLNDIPSGEGETEFLWQKLRVNPEAGTLIVWPAAFTHVHRGNPVYSHDKYVATGWYCYLE